MQERINQELIRICQVGKAVAKSIFRHYTKGQKGDKS